MKQQLAGRSTFAKLLLRDKLPVPDPDLARLFGFELQPEEFTADGFADSGMGAGNTTGEEAGHKLLQPDAAQSPENQRRHRSVEFWQAAEIVECSATRAGGDKIATGDGTDSTDADEPLQIFPRRPFAPLARIPDIRVRLRQQPALTRQTNEPDVDRLAEQFSRGQLPVRIPCLEKRSWGDSVCVIQDVSKRLYPYHNDMGMLCHWLGMYGPQGQTFTLYSDRNGSVPENWPFITSPREKYGGRMPSVSGATFLVMSDLGTLQRIDSRPQKSWERMGRILSGNDNRLIALVPCRADSIPDSLRAHWQIVQWERGELDDSGPPSEQETDAAVNLLLVLLSMADCIEPQLLRRVRRLIPEGRRDAGLESRFCQHPDVRSDNPDGAVIHPEVRQRLIQKRLSQPRKLQQAVFDEICRMHEGEFAGLMNTEILNLGQEAERFVPVGNRKNAERWYSQIGAGESVDPDLRRFFRIAATQLTQPAMESYPILHELWDRICGSDPNSIPPVGFDPRQVSSRPEVTTLSVCQLGADLQFTLPSAGRGRENVADDPQGSLIGKIRLRSGYLEIDSLQGLPGSKPLRNRFWHLAPPLWASAWDSDDLGSWCEFTVNGICQRMRWILPGTFLMGSPEDEDGRWDDEGPQHEVTLSKGFWMFDTPCTQELWQAVMGENPSHFPGAKRPVEKVSWQDCQKFIEKLNLMLPGLNLSLPSEAQWEYACRASTKTATYAGPLSMDDKQARQQLDGVAWYSGNSGSGTHDVRENPENPWGLYDMLGNVDEWCLDGMRDYTDEAASDPVGSTSALRVIRGGSWLNSARFVRAAYRIALDPSNRSNNLGFRCSSSGHEPVRQEGGAGAKRSEPEAERGGDSEAKSDDRWVNLRQGMVQQKPVPKGPVVRIRSDVEELLLKKITRPAWASDMGRDEYGLWSEFTVKSVRQRLRWIPPGRFLMGSPESEKGRIDGEGPQQEILHSEGFWMFDTPCTQELWETMMETTPSHFKGLRNPVENVSWDDCKKFLEKLNKELNREIREEHDRLILALPLETQWEYACRAGRQTPIWSGSSQVGDAVHDEQLARIAWYDENSGGTTHEVATRAANPWGLHDMLGNVWEWCRDNWRDRYDAAPTSAIRVIRGGSWNDTAQRVRAAFRFADVPSIRVYDLGFRCSSSGHEPVRIEGGAGAERSEPEAERGGDSEAKSDDRGWFTKLFDWRSLRGRE